MAAVVAPTLWLVAAGVLLLLPSGCAGAVTALEVVAASSTLAVNECHVSIGTFVQGERPTCWPRPAPGAARWR